MVPRVRRPRQHAGPAAAALGRPGPAPGTAPIRSLPETSVGPPVCAVAPHPFFPRLASGALDSTVRLWEPAGDGPAPLWAAPAIARANASAMASRTMRVDQPVGWYSMAGGDVRGFGGLFAAGMMGGGGAFVAAPAPRRRSGPAAVQRDRRDGDDGGDDDGPGGGGGGAQVMAGCSVM